MSRAVAGAPFATVASKEQGWRTEEGGAGGGAAVRLRVAGGAMAAAGCEVGEGEGQYGQRRHSSGVTLFDDVNFANPFYIMAKERN
jgi:hypothetical protein